jgi:hypothetical protein
VPHDPFRGVYPYLTSTKYGRAPARREDLARKIAERDGISEGFVCVFSGEHALHGFTNRDLRHKLARTPIPLAADALKRSAQITRLFAPPPRPQLDRQDSAFTALRVSLSGRRTMAAALKLRELAFPRLYVEAA